MGDTDRFFDAWDHPLQNFGPVKAHPADGVSDRSTSFRLHHHDD